MRRRVARWAKLCAEVAHHKAVERFGLRVRRHLRVAGLVRHKNLENLSEESSRRIFGMAAARRGVTSVSQSKGSGAESLQSVFTLESPSAPWIPWPARETTRLGPFKEDSSVSKGPCKNL